MRLPTIRSLFTWRSKSAKPPLTAQELRDALLYAQGFNLGASEGVRQLLIIVREQAINETLERLDTTITERAESAGKGNLRPMVELQRKRTEFLQKRQLAQDPPTQQKYDHYLEALDWALRSNGH